MYLWLVALEGKTGDEKTIYLFKLFLKMFFGFCDFKRHFMVINYRKM